MAGIARVDAPRRHPERFSCCSHGLLGIEEVQVVAHPVLLLLLRRRVAGAESCADPAGRHTAKVAHALGAAGRHLCQLWLPGGVMVLDLDAVVAEAARGVDLLKLNDEELMPLAQALHLTAANAAETDAAAVACAAAALADSAMEKEEAEEAMALIIAEAAAAVGRAAQAGSVVVTRGSQGAVYWDGAVGDAWSCAGFVPPTVVDTVGAGDSFLAGLLASRLVHGAEPPEALEAGCRCGAFVASRAGATPAHEPEAMDALRPPDGAGAPKPLLVGGVRV